MILSMEKNLTHRKHTVHFSEAQAREVRRAGVWVIPNQEKMKGVFVFGMRCIFSFHTPSYLFSCFAVPLEY